jgi:hypothetical protein
MALVISSRAFVKQQLSDRLMAVVNGGSQWCPSGVSHGVHLSPAIEQQPYHIVMPLVRCPVEGCAAIVGGHRRNGTCVEKEADSIRVTATRRVDERRVTILPPSIHVRSFSEQPLDARNISPTRRAENQFVVRASHECPAPGSSNLQEFRPPLRETSSNVPTPIIPNVAN